MCGIFSAINLDIDRSVLNSNLLKMRHRGPDFQNDLQINNIYLGHNRLSIIDLNIRSNQPFSYIMEKFIIIKN